MAFYRCGNCGMPFETTDDAVSVNCPRCGAYQILREVGDSREEPAKEAENMNANAPQIPAPVQEHPATGQFAPPFEEEREPAPGQPALTQIYRAPDKGMRMPQQTEQQESPAVRGFADNSGFKDRGFGDDGFPPVPPKKKKGKKWLLIGIIAGILVIALVVTGVIFAPKLFGKKQDKDNEEASAAVRISVSEFHAVGLKKDGTVVATAIKDETHDFGQCEVGEWSDVISVSAGYYHTVGLKKDGTVVATAVKDETHDDGQCKVESWKDITAVAAGQYHTVGLKKNGTVVAVGFNGDHQCDVSEWTDITAISAVGNVTVGLKEDGTVVATGENEAGQCEVSDWTDVTAIAAGQYHTVGLKKDGTVVSTKIGDDTGYYYGQCDVDDWTDIVAIASGSYHTVGLKKDGTVVSTQIGESSDYYYGQCDVESWTDITEIAAGVSNTIGLKKDGTVVSVGDNTYGQNEVSGWKLNDE